MKDNASHKEPCNCIGQLGLQDSSSSPSLRLIAGRDLGVSPGSALCETKSSADKTRSP